MFACIFISVPTILPHYLCNGNIFHFNSLDPHPPKPPSSSTVDNVTFFMIQLIIFGFGRSRRASLYLYWNVREERATRLILSYANCGRLLVGSFMRLES